MVPDVVSKDRPCDILCNYRPVHLSTPPLGPVGTEPHCRLQNRPLIGLDGHRGIVDMKEREYHNWICCWVADGVYAIVVACWRRPRLAITFFTGVDMSPLMS